MSIGDDNDTSNGGNCQPTTGDDQWTMNLLEKLAQNSQGQTAALLQHSAALDKQSAALDKQSAALDKQSAALNKQSESDLMLNRTFEQFIAQRGSKFTSDASSPNYVTTQSVSGNSPNDVMLHVPGNNTPNQPLSIASSDNEKQPQLPPTLHRFQDNTPEGFGATDPSAGVPSVTEKSTTTHSDDDESDDERSQDLLDEVPNNAAVGVASTSTSHCSNDNDKGGKKRGREGVLVVSMFVCHILLFISVLNSPLCIAFCVL